jgi:hypothetical protein
MHAAVPEHVDTQITVRVRKQCNTPASRRQGPRGSSAVVAETGTAWPCTQPTWIFTHRTLPVTEGADIRFVHGDVRRIHEEMQAAAGGKNIWIAGGGSISGARMRKKFVVNGSSPLHANAFMRIFPSDSFHISNLT